jgi:hypothetical protein
MVSAAAAARFRRWWVLLLFALGAAVAIWAVWRQLHPSTPSRLFSRLPADQALHLYLDIANARSSQAVRALFGSQSHEAPEYRQFVEGTGFNYLTDLDAAALSMSQDQIHLVAQGRFDEQRIRSYLTGQGGQCDAPLLVEPCAIPASQTGRLLSFRMLDGDLLAMANAAEPDAVARLAAGPSPDARGFATLAQSFVDRGGILWLTVDPPSLERAMQDPPAGALNLMLFARALETAERGYLGLENSENASLVLRLRGVCSSEQKAEKLGEMLSSLNRLVGGAIEMGAQGGPPSPWSSVIKSGTFVREGNGVEGRWRIPGELLKQLAAE